MPTLTIDQLKVLPFGYLTGADLLQYCPGQLLIKQFEVDSNCLAVACSLAYSQAIGHLSTRYDVSDEIKNSRADLRCTLLVNIVSIIAVRAALGNLQNIGEAMMNNFKWADDMLIAIRNGQMNLILNEAAAVSVSVAELVCGKFKTLG